MALIHHYKLNETSGSTAIVSAGSVDGTIYGATLGVSGATGKTDTAYSFSGSDNVELNQGGVTDLSEFTVSAWVNRDTVGSSGECIFYDDVNTLTFLRETFDSSSVLQFQIGASNSESVTTGNLNTNEWYHVVGVWRDSTDIRIYINGQLEASKTHSTLRSESRGNGAEIGAESLTVNSRFIEADIDDVRIYDVALSDSEVQSLYDSYTAISPPSGVTVTASTEDELTVDWSPVSNATSYNVYRAQSSGSSKPDYTQVANVGSPPYIDTGLEDGERYYYRVSSVN